jgi:AcrR family transcriptional regulator
MCGSGRIPRKTRPVQLFFSEQSACFCSFSLGEARVNTDRRVRRTQKLLHSALVSLILERNYDSITIQEILNRADIGRSTFYAHFKGKDELLISGIHELRHTLDSAIHTERSPAKRHEAVVGFSLAMFQHASEYREVYHALLNTQGWPVFRQRLEEMFDDIIRRECKTAIQRLKKSDSDVPVDLFVHYLTAGFFSVLTWWLGRRSRLTPPQINEIFRSLVLPTVNAVLDV